MRHESRIFLVGMMGSGKTTIGRKLARQLQADFADIDQDIEKATGVSVATIFELEGEAGFREREARALRDRARSTSLSGKAVIATGGGAVLNPLNRARMIASGQVVYLHANPALLYARTRHDKGRPLLQVANPEERIRTLVERRDPLYREIATLVLEAGSGIHHLVSAIIALEKRSCQS